MLPGSRTCDEMHYGGPAYGHAVVARLVDVLGRHVGPDRAIRVPDLVREAGVPGSPLRAAYGDLDGDRFCLGRTRDGLYVARTRAEAEALTREMERHIATLQRRVDRRCRWWFGGAPIREVAS